MEHVPSHTTYFYIWDKDSNNCQPLNPQKIILNLTRTYVIDAEKKNHIDLVVSGTVQTDTQTAILFLLYNHNHLDHVHFGRKEEL